MYNKEFLIEENQLRKAITNAYRMPEEECINSLLKLAMVKSSEQQSIKNKARKLVIDVRKMRVGKGGLDAFMLEYNLSSEEGIALMCMAEALLRVPDSNTVDLLIKDKLSSKEWGMHLGKSPSTFVNAATWALMLTGKIIKPETKDNHLSKVLSNLFKKSGEPVIRQAVRQAMKILGNQFVMGQNIKDAIKRAKTLEGQGYHYSYDMLGEEAVTQSAADIYYQSYISAIKEIGRVKSRGNPIDGPGISVKLSALHPRYEFINKTRVFKELYPRLKEIVALAVENNINITIDAEEVERLDMSLDLITKIMQEPFLQGFIGFGLAVQAYQKRASFVLDYIIDLARSLNLKICIRLVKGAYWDTEVKLAQINGYEGYPVFTRKVATDVSYLACVNKLFAASDVIYPQFATHNAYTVAYIQEAAGMNYNYEFQCLHGMGDALYANIVAKDDPIKCRIYAPVGGHKELLAYLVRRLLENGANSSFVNRIIDERLPIDEMIACPIEKWLNHHPKSHPKTPIPADIYSDRKNSAGFDFTNIQQLQSLLNKLNTIDPVFSACSKFKSTNVINAISPIDGSIQGSINIDSEFQIKQAASLISESEKEVLQLDIGTRCQVLHKMSTLLEEHKVNLLYLLCHEAGKTLQDAVAELREAIDFCNYYALMSRELEVKTLVGPTGEINELHTVGRGCVLCISPWNFPLAIFLGQVTAAYVTGNVVIAKPALETALIASYAIELMYAAGANENAIHMLLSSGRDINSYLLPMSVIKAVMFTGSTDTANKINKTLTERGGEIIPLIAETGGQNAMIVDSSALHEQVVKDVILSAFGSCGQRCSSLRVLYLQEDIADEIIEMIIGAMAELRVGNPIEMSVDIGPVISQEALAPLMAHTKRMDNEAKLLYKVEIDADLQGNFIAPAAYLLNDISQLTEEVFGPILHIIKYKNSDLLKVIEDINSTGFGLTLGIHSRIDETIESVIKHAKVGNIYVNRNMIGAVVGVQPFGGEGLSGTGPKAGGPNYLPRLVKERTISIDTTAAGGNASLMAIID